MPYYSSECFSGECGLCFQCNRNNNEVRCNRFPQDDNLKKSLVYDITLYSENFIGDLHKEYNTKLNNIKKINGVKNDNNNKKYKLHDCRDICDNIRCQSFYMKSDNHMKRYYEKLPIYKRYDGHCNLCIVCIDE